MAHKTFSQEQLKWSSYSIVLPHETELKNNLYGVNQSLSFLLKIRESVNSSNVSTNLLFLKKSSFRCFFRLGSYFKF